MTGERYKMAYPRKMYKCDTFLPLNESQVLLLVHPVIKYFFRSTVDQMSVDRQVIFIYIFSLFQNVGLLWLLLLDLRILNVSFVVILLRLHFSVSINKAIWI